MRHRSLARATVLLGLVFATVACESGPFHDGDAPSESAVAVATPAPCPQPTPSSGFFSIFSDDGPVLGAAHSEGFNIAASDLGLDIWENGKLLDMKAQWSLFCGTSVGSRPDCQLDQIVIRGTLTRHFGWAVAFSPETFTTSGGNLRIRRADVKAGALDLQLLRPNGPETEVELRFVVNDLPGALFLDTLRAVEAFRQPNGDLLTREYRLTEYNSVIMVPVYLTGRFPPQRREWEAVLAELTPADRAIWERLIAEPGNRPRFDDDVFERLLKDKIPDWKEVAEGKRKRTPEEDPIVSRASIAAQRQGLTGWLAQSGLSPAGQAAVLEFRERQVKEVMVSP